MKKKILVVLGLVCIMCFIGCMSARVTISEPEPEVTPEQVVINAGDYRFFQGRIVSTREVNYPNGMVNYYGHSFGIKGLDIDNEYSKIDGRLSVGGPFVFSVINYNVIKIDGLMTVAEFDAYVVAEKERRAEFLGSKNSYYVVDWSKAFPTKEEAQIWWTATINGFNDVVDVIKAREKLYDDDVKGFKLFPSKATLDIITRDKNNLIEAYNRFRPIVSEIEQVADKGVTFQMSNSSNPTLGYRSGLPTYKNWNFGLTEEQMSGTIEQINRDYAKLVDTYPIN